MNKFVVTIVTVVVGVVLFINLGVFQVELNTTVTAKGITTNTTLGTTKVTP